MGNTYSNGETDNEQTGGGNHGSTDGLAGVGILTVGVEGKGTEGGEDDEPDEHPQTSDDHGDTATELLTNVETTKSSDHVDGAKNHGGDERVGDTNRVKDLCAVVEEEVGAGKLLQRLKRHADQDAAHHGGRSENLVPLLVATGHLGLETLANVTESVLDLGVVLVTAGDQSQGLRGLSLAAVAELPARRLAHDEHADGHDGGCDEADAHGDAPRGGGGNGLGAEVDAVGDKDTEGNEELVGGDQGAADLARRCLGLVHGSQDGQGADAKAINEAADNDLVPLALSGDADNVADDVDNVPEGDAVLAAELVRERTRDESTHQAANAKHTNHQALSHVAELEAVVFLNVTKAIPEVVDLCVTGDGTTFPSEDETAERDEQAHD